MYVDLPQTIYFESPMLHVVLPVRLWNPHDLY